MDPRMREDDEKREDDVTRAVIPALLLSFLRRQESIPAPRHR